MSATDVVRRPAAAAEKPEGLRQAMAWLHTWSGLVFGWVLFAMFLTGTLAFFRPEINAWMKPELNVRPVSEAQSIAQAVRYLSKVAPDATRWYITPSTPRAPEVQVSYQDPRGGRGRGGFETARLDPADGSVVQARASRGGEFFYRFHFELEMGYPWGRWLASIAGMFMLIAIISGVITHKKIFADFFTFRPAKGGQRAWMDGHNALSVLGLPFHLMITFTGLLLFMSMLMPAGTLARYDTDRQFFAEVYPAFADTPASGQAAMLAPLMPMVDTVRQRWAGATVGRIIVNHPGDAVATVSISGSPSDRVSAGRLPPSVTFNGVTGEVVSASADDNAVRTTAGTLIGLHRGLFAQPLLRWLYFLVSMAGTAMVGTGLLLWVAKRRKKAGRGAGERLSLRMVESLNIGAMAGLFIAIACFFAANRLIDPQAGSRAALEVNVFFYSWAAACVYAFVRRRTAWRDLLALGGALYVLLPVLNSFTTPRGLLHSLAAGDWVFAGFDSTVLTAGLLLLWLSIRAHRVVRRTHAAHTNEKLAHARAAAVHVRGA